MKKISIYLGIILSYCLISCAGNDDIETIRPWTEEYVLPQGKSDADDRIVEYYEKFGTYILYDYTYMDFHYETGGSYEYKLPDPIYVGNMLDLLEEIWFSFYPDDFHKKYMPLKILLADYIRFKEPVSGAFQEKSFFISSRSCFVFGFCSDVLQEITSTTKLEYKNSIHSSLWGYYLDGRIEYPEEFFAVSDYSRGAEMDPSSEDYARNRGFVAYIGYDWSLYPDGLTGQLDKKMDVTSFLMNMIVRTSMQWEDDLQWPLVKQKYDILRNFLQDTYGFDVQKVGDATYE